MKKIWKVLGISAAAASLLPYCVRKNRITGETEIDAFLWQVKRGPDPEIEGRDRITLNFGLKSRIRTLREIQEAKLFADDEPEAALIEVDGAAPDTIIAEDTDKEIEASPDDFEPEV